MENRNLDVSCPMGCNAAKNSSHLLMSCNFARAVWLAVMGRISDQNQDLKEWIISWFEDCHSGHISETTQGVSDQAFVIVQVSQEELNVRISTGQ